MSSPLVSIIIPTYNRAHLIGETLDSVLSQTYSHWECIVVDDGSTDGTAALLDTYCAKDPRIQYYQRPEDRPKGANACRNYGFEVSTGDYVNWFDDDDLMVENKLGKQVKDLEHSSLSFTVCQTLLFNEDPKNVLRLRKAHVYSATFFDDFIQDKIKWLTQAPLIKKSFLVEQDLSFDESLSCSQERDFFIRLLALVDNYEYTQEPLVLFRVHDSSISHSVLTASKLESYFKVDFNIYISFKSKISLESKLYLKTKLKSYFREMVMLDFKPQITTCMKQLFNPELGLTFKERLRIWLGILSYRVFNKGERFFK